MTPKHRELVYNSVVDSALKLEVPRVFAQPYAEIAANDYVSGKYQERSVSQMIEKRAAKIEKMYKASLKALKQKCPKESPA